MKRQLLLALAALFLASVSFAVVDTNENGLSDLWEKQHHNGELFPETFDPQADPDADGWTNAQEAVAGTNPFDPNPPDGLIRPQTAHVPAVMEEDEWGPYVATPEAVTVTWPTLVGKKYTLLWSLDLSGESWIPLGSPFVGNGNIVEYGFPTGDLDKRFWRVAVEDADTDGDLLSDFEEHQIGSSIYLADTDGDGTDDSDAYALGVNPSGDGSDADGDGVPDNEIYTVEFEIQDEWHTLGRSIGKPPLAGDTTQSRYLTETVTEEYSIAGSPRYENIASGEHKTINTWLDGEALTEDGESSESVEGESLSNWKNAHPVALGSGESLWKQATVTSTSAPTIIASEQYATTTETTPWEVTKSGSVIRSGTEVIISTDRTKLSDEVSYADVWSDHFKSRVWTASEPEKWGPPEISAEHLQYYSSPVAAAESVRESYRRSDFPLSGVVSLAGSGYSTGSDLCNAVRLKSLRWRWVRFNPNNPFSREYATPPASIRKQFTLSINRTDYEGVYNPYGWSGTPTNTVGPDLIGLVTIECKGTEGTSSWAEVPLSKFDAYKMENPPDLATMDFHNWTYSDVHIGNMPIEFLPPSDNTVSADDHQVSFVLSLDQSNANPDDSIIEWEVASGTGGNLMESETTVSEGLTVATLSTSSLKDAEFRVRARIKQFGLNGNDISISSAWIESPLIRVTAGKPHTIALTATKSSYRSDGTDTSEITATIKDQYGNLVEDDTPVSWTVAQCPTPPFISTDDATVDGIAKAVLRAPLIPDDQIVTCIAGDKQNSITVAVTGVTGSIAGNVNLDIGTAQQSTVTVTAQAADGTPVYWTSSNGTITAHSTIENGSATTTLNASGGRLGKVVVTATVGDHLFYTEGQFSSTAGLAIGADHPVLIANATADGIHTPTFEHGIARQIPYYASTPIRIKGPPGGLAHLTIEASVVVGSWSFDEAVGTITPSENGLRGMTLSNASIDEEVQHSGAGSLRFDGNASGSVADSPEFHFTDQFNASVWLRPSEVTAATFAEKEGSWHIGQLADGRVQASVTTDTGTYVATTTDSLTLDQWTLLVVDFRFNRLQIKLDHVAVATCATTGSILVTTNPISVGTGFHGNLDHLTFQAADNPASHVTLSGLAAGNTLQLDMMGEGSFTMTSTGAAAGGASIRIFSKVNPEAETEVALVDPGFWDYTWDTVASFVGGDPQTNAGTVSSIAGGFLVVGDVGSCTKNLWRMAGWSDKKPNYVELSLGGLGILTTFAEVTVVGAPADAGVASIKTLSIRFGSNPKAVKFLTVFIEQIKNAVVGGGRFGWAEANFLGKMVSDIPVSDAFKLFMHDDALARAAVHATEKLGANAESFYQATRRAVASHGEDAAKKFVQAFEGLGNEAFDALKNAPAGELDEALDGLAKVANKGIAPFTLTRVLNNPHLYGSAYKRTNLLKDLGELADIPNLKGLEDAIPMLKATNAQAKGFRYEIEGAAWLARNNHNVVELTRRVSVDWERWLLGSKTGKTDIDVIVEEGGELICYQFKRSAEALKSLEMNKAWVTKVLKEFKDEGNYSRIRYALPNGIDDLTPVIKTWFESVGILPGGVKAIPHLD